MSEVVSNVSPSRAELRVVTANHLIATWRNVVILIWRRDTTVEGVRAAQAVYDVLASSFPGGVFLLTVVEENAPAPPADPRRDLGRFLASGAGRTILSAVVHEGTGFRAAMVRSVVTGLALLTKLPYPHNIFATVGDAETWLRETSPIARAWRKGELEGIVSQLRGQSERR